MAKLVLLATLLALAGCAGMPSAPPSSSPCASNPGGYDCQVEMYMKAP